MKRIFKYTFILALTFSFVNANAIIKERNKRNPGDLGIKTYINTNNYTPHSTTDGAADSQTVFTFGDDIRVGDMYDMTVMEEIDFGENGVLDWHYLFVFKQDSSVIHGWLAESSLVTWDNVQNAILAGYTAVSFFSGNNTSAFQPGE